MPIFTGHYGMFFRYIKLHKTYFFPFWNKSVFTFFLMVFCHLRCEIIPTVRKRKNIVKANEDHIFRLFNIPSICTSKIWRWWMIFFYLIGEAWEFLQSLLFFLYLLANHSAFGKVRSSDCNFYHHPLVDHCLLK